jgi:hypothetical protein
MQKNKVDLMVESFFKPVAKKNNELSLDDLISIINEVKSTIPSLVMEAGERMNLGGGFGGNISMSEPTTPSSKSAKTIDLSSIPEISVSELGWASLKTSDTGEQISSPQRTQLEQYLSNIEGDTFAAKIQSISKIYELNPEEIQNASFLQGETNAGKIQKTLSYLVFLKTLTTIITNFNAASAGFSFEAFLGVLLGGTQVATASGTIADLHAGDGTPISLKLYAEATLSVGGSFSDLVGDMVQPKTNVELMRYIVVTKNLSGEKLDLQGTVSVYQFDITLDNIFNVMNLSQNSDLIRLPQQFIENPQDFDASNLKRKKLVANQEEVSAQFLSSLSNAVGEQIANDIMNRIKSEDGNNVFKSKDEDKQKIGFSTFNPTFLNDYKKDKNTFDAIQIANKEASQVVAKQTSSDITKQNDANLKALQFADPQASSNWYQSASKEMKKQALKNTYGYLHTEQFEMTRNQVFSVMQNKVIGRGGEASKPIGVIKIGAKNVQEIVNKLAQNLNSSIFEIFTNLSTLTSSINSYFATGLKDENLANTAQTAAQNIDKKTGEIKQAK